MNITTGITRDEYMAMMSNRQSCSLISFKDLDIVFKTRRLLQQTAKFRLGDIYDIAFDMFGNDDRFYFEDHQEL